MSKKLIVAAVAVLVAVGACVSANMVTSGSKLTKLQRANVEALADNVEQSKEKTCYDDIHAKDGCMVRYCPECRFVSGTDDLLSFKKTCK